MPIQTSNRHQNLVMFGCNEEEDEKDVKKRFDNMSQTVKTNLESIGVKMESSVSDIFRRGKRTTGKNRPIVLRTTNVWEKRNILAGFRTKKVGQNLSFTIREDYPPHPNLKKFKEEARKLNHDLKTVAENENTPVTKSYSARQDGVVLFILKNGKWQQE